MKIDSSEMEPGEFKRIRENLGVSQKELADAISIHFGTVYRYESGDRIIPGPISALMRILDNYVKENEDG